MSTASDVVPLFRTEWANRLVDSCDIDRTTAQGTFNAATLQYDSPTVVQQYTGTCLVRPSSRSRPDYGQEAADQETYDLHLPHTATGIAVGDVVTVTASTYDPDLVSATFEIQEIVEDSYLTHYRFVMTRVKP